MPGGASFTAACDLWCIMGVTRCQTEDGAEAAGLGQSGRPAVSANNAERQ